VFNISGLRKKCKDGAGP